MPSSLTWPLVAVIAMLLAGATFLGYEHDLTGAFVASIYGAIVGGTLVGHFSSTGVNNG